MNAVLVIASVLGPLLPVAMFPGKLIARGGPWRFVGAGLIVGAALMLCFSLQALVTDTAQPGSTDTTATAGLTDADLSALDSVFN
jgi:hypothetical protein